MKDFGIELVFTIVFIIIVAGLGFILESIMPEWLMNILGIICVIAAVPAFIIGNALLGLGLLFGAFMFFRMYQGI